MAEVIWTQAALGDLNEIAEYIDVSNPTAARKLVANVMSALERLELFPESGRLVYELDDLGCREVLVNPCRVIYKVSDAQVYVLHVFRQEQDLKRYILS